MLSIDLIRSNLADEQPYVVSFERQNIEFSCPAASAQHSAELAGFIRRSWRPPRGQLQRFVVRLSSRIDCAMTEKDSSTQFVKVSG
jgi:hypothetical protein